MTLADPTFEDAVAFQDAIREFREYKAWQKQGNKAVTISVYLRVKYTLPVMREIAKLCQPSRRMSDLVY